MKTLSEAQLEDLLLEAQTIEQDGLGLKVARLQDGDFLKLFRRRRLLSSALWLTPARRFSNNAQCLLKLGIAAPTIKELLLIPSRQLNAVRYLPLPGDTLRNCWRAMTDPARELEVQRFGAFLGQLHQLGVYFRSLHLGNVLLLPSGEFGLIDLSDMTIAGRPLSSGKRRRNLQHMLRYAEDIDWLAQRHRTALLNGYRHSCGSAQTERLARGLQAWNPKTAQ